MAKVLVVGGVFFKSPDPAKLRACYSRWLGVPGNEHGTQFRPDALDPAGNKVELWQPKGGAPA